MKKRTKNLRLRAFRNFADLTQGELAKKVGKSQGWICGLENGYFTPSDVEIAIICRVLKAPPDEVFPPNEQEDSTPESANLRGIKLSDCGGNRNEQHPKYMQEPQHLQLHPEFSFPCSCRTGEK